jgi:phospholipase C
VIFQENVSFDHYFGTYPDAANTDGTPFHAKPGTPHVNGHPGPAHQQPELRQPAAADPVRGAQLRPEPLYDHEMSTIINPSHDPASDALNGPVSAAAARRWPATRTGAASVSGCR